MTDTTISGAVCFPQDSGSGVPEDEEDYSSAGFFSLLSKYKGEGSYVGEDTSGDPTLQFNDVDTSNEQVDVSPGYAYIMDSMSVQSGFQTVYDVALPNESPYVVILPDEVVNLDLGTDNVNDVWLAVDPTSNDSVYIRHGNGLSAPSDPSVKLGTVDTSSGATTRANDGAPSGAFRDEDGDDVYTLPNSTDGIDVGLVSTDQIVDKRVFGPGDNLQTMIDDVASHSDVGPGRGDSSGIVEIATSDVISLNGEIDVKPGVRIHNGTFSPSGDFPAFFIDNRAGLIGSKIVTANSGFSKSTPAVEMDTSRCSSGSYGPTDGVQLDYEAKGDFMNGVGLSINDSAAGGVSGGNQIRVDLRGFDIGIRGNLGGSGAYINAPAIRAILDNNSTADVVKTGDALGEFKTRIIGFVQVSTDEGHAVLDNQAGGLFVHFVGEIYDLNSQNSQLLARGENCTFELQFNGVKGASDPIEEMGDGSIRQFAIITGDGDQWSLVDMNHANRFDITTPPGGFSFEVNDEQTFVISESGLSVQEPLQVSHEEDGAAAGDLLNGQWAFDKTNNRIVLKDTGGTAHYIDTTGTL